MPLPRCIIYRFFSELLSVHPELCPYQICALRRGRWGLRLRSGVLGGSLGAARLAHVQPAAAVPAAGGAAEPRALCPGCPAFGGAARTPLLVVAQKKGSAVKFCSLALSGLCFIPTVPWQ